MAMVQIWDIILKIIVFLITFVVLRLCLWFEVLFYIASVVLALYLADFFIKMLRDSLPTKLLLPCSDKAVLITGCDTGFGHKFAKELDAKGVAVFAGCLYSDGPGAKQLKESCSKNLHILQLDVCNDDQVKSAVQNVVNNLEGKRLWAVVNNAGIIVVSEAEYTSIETTRRILDVNTLGVARVTQAFLPLLRQNKGRVVIVTSVAGRVCLPLISSYTMSKHATMAYAQTLRRELLRWRVSVHTIEPWGFNTAMADYEVIQRNTKNQWYQAPESVRAEYGGDNYIHRFFEAFLKSYKDQNETRLHLVTDCLMDAAIGRYPKLNYFPGFPGRVVIYLNNKLPSSLMDFIMQKGLPKI